MRSTLIMMECINTSMADVVFHRFESVWTNQFDTGALGATNPQQPRSTENVEAAAIETRSACRLNSWGEYRFES